MTSEIISLVFYITFCEQLRQGDWCFKNGREARKLNKRYLICMDQVYSDFFTYKVLLSQLLKQDSTLQGV